MIFKLQVIILTLALLHSPGLYSKGSTKSLLTSVELDSLLYIHKDIISGDKGHSNIQKNGKNLIDQTFKFINNPQNKKLLLTTSGQELLRHQVMLGNYLAVKSHFEKCIKNKNSKRDLNSRVLDSTLQSMKNDNISISPCYAVNKDIKDLASFSNQIMKTMKSTIGNTVKQDLSDTILINSARAMLNLKYKFDPGFTASQKQIEDLVSKSPMKNKTELLVKLINYSEKIKINEKKLSLLSIRTGITTSLQNLKKNDSASQLLSEIKTPAGVLLLTPALKNKKDAVYWEDINQAIKESEAQINEEVQDTLSETSTDGLVKINPFATGEMLLSHPEYAGVVCDSINKINTTDIGKDKRDRYFRIGSAVLGGALLLTGVGAIAGAYVLTGSLSAGLVAGTVAGTIVTATTAGSVIAGLGAALYEGNSAYQAHKETTQLENAFLSNNGDSQNIVEARAALENYKENRTNAMISLASAGLGVANFSKLFSMMKLGSKSFGISEMKTSSKILDYVADTKVAKKLKTVSLSLGEYSQVKIDTFLYRLAQGGESIRTKILEMLKDTRFTPKEMQQMFEEALAAAKNCAK